MAGENPREDSGRALAPDRFWNMAMDTMISTDDEGPCMGIEVNMWERAKVKLLCIYIVLIMRMFSMFYVDTTSYCAHIGGRRRHSTVVMMPLITVKSSKETLDLWETIQSYQCCQISLPDFCLSSMLIYLRASICLCCLLTEVTLMYMKHLKTIR